MSSATLETPLAAAVSAEASRNGLVVLTSSTRIAELDGNHVAVFELAASPDAAADHRILLQVSDSLALSDTKLRTGLAEFFSGEASRLQNPIPGAMVTLGGIPLLFGGFNFPFHRSTSGADTYVVHGEVRLANEPDSPLHAKVAASLTLTIVDALPAPEQPYTQDLIFNAIRKTVDLGQIELVKSGNRQPVPVTSRYYSFKQGKTTFTDTDAAARKDFIELKTFWQSGVMGTGAPVWLTDPRDAQYLNTSLGELNHALTLAAEAGMVELGTAEHACFGRATDKLMAREAEFRERMDAALAVTKPAFNEAMRAGQANM